MPPPTKKNKGGRPSKFTKEIKKQIEFLARKGFTEQEIADALLIDQSTITKWKQKNHKFFTSLNEWKAEADRKVERSLFERATGYESPETKVFCSEGEIITHNVTKCYPPDSTSMIFWLKNRRPEKWRDKHELDIKATVVRNKKRFDGT